MSVVVRKAEVAEILATVPPSCIGWQSIEETHMASTPTDLSAVRKPIANALGLPNGHYTDPALHAEESQALLQEGWSGLAVTADVPEPGDAVPLEFMGIPLLLLRDRSGVVRVFQNICRHRGMILVEEPRKIEGAIRCPCLALSSWPTPCAQSFGSPF